MTVPAGRTSTLIASHSVTYHNAIHRYIDRAAKANFGVVDVNVPDMITMPTHYDGTPVYPEDERILPYASPVTDLARREASDLAKYLWNNYIEPMVESDTKIILLGAGHAFHAVARLVSDSEILYQQLAGVIGFIATNPVRPVSNNNSPWVSAWYKQNSQIFVSETHSLWAMQKLSRKYGVLKKSEAGTVTRIMQEEEESAWQWIMGKVNVGRSETESGDEVHLVENVVLPGEGLGLVPEQATIDISMGAMIEREQ